MQNYTPCFEKPILPVATSFAYSKSDRNLVDVYHVSDYLAAVAKICSSAAAVWMEQQKEALKSSQSSTILAALLPHIEPHFVEDKDAAVRKAHRYLRNRRKQLNYKGAIGLKLPIGSRMIIGNTAQKKNAPHESSAQL